MEYTMADRPVRPDQGVTGPDARPALDALIHLSGVVPVGAAMAVAGRPAIYLFILLPLGPLLFGTLLAGRRRMGLLHRARATELGLTIGLGMLLVFAVTSVALRTDALAILIPIGILLILGMAANWVFLTFSAVARALRSLSYPHPWVIRLPFIDPDASEPSSP